MTPDLHDKMQKNHVKLCYLSMGPEGRVCLVRLLGILWIRDEYGIFEKVSYGLTCAEKCLSNDC